uniref:(California timema) hypothetical protein n=1 Tax=Timema californicum TaxID=61474 RepID=A0A7R9PCI9_TIMCA|nr:unnamed protein product [Timema californicum]
MKKLCKSVKANNRIFKHGEALIEPGLAGAIEPISLVSPREVCVLLGFSLCFVLFREEPPSPCTLKDLPEPLNHKQYHSNHQQPPSLIFIPEYNVTSSHLEDEVMTKAKKFILARHFDGEPKESDLKLVEEELPPIKDGETCFFPTVDNKSSFFWFTVGPGVLSRQYIPLYARYAMIVPLCDGRKRHNLFGEFLYVPTDMDVITQPPPRSLGPDDRVSYTRLRYVRPLLLASVVRPCELYTSQVRQTPPPSLSRTTV